MGWDGMGGAEIYMRLVFQRQTKKILPNILTLAIGQVRERGYTMESWTSQPNQKMPHLSPNLDCPFPMRQNYV